MYFQLQCMSGFWRSWSCIHFLVIALYFLHLQRQYSNKVRGTYTYVLYIIPQSSLSMVLKCLFIIPHTDWAFFVAWIHCSVSFKSLVTQTPRSFSTVIVFKHAVLFPSDIVYTVGSSCSICMTLHLSMLKESNYFFDHSINKFRSCCKNSLSSMSLILVHIFVSSANIIRLHLTKSGRSLTNIKNNKGPRTDPCGTPLSTSIQLEKLPFICTFICLPNKNWSIHFVSVSPSFNPFSFCISLWWGTVSKAFL